MFKKKKKCFIVTLIKDEVLLSTMTIVGCEDEDECLKFALVAKERGYEIQKIKEVNQTPYLDHAKK